LKRAESIERSHGSPAVNGVAYTQRTLAHASLTKEQFESSVTKKSGRVSDLARRFGVEDSVITNFLNQPDSKVEIAGRGWIKAKEEFRTQT